MNKQQLANQLHDKLFLTTGAFFAFSTKQFNEAKTADTKYVDLGAGLICPKVNMKELIEGMTRISKQVIAIDLEQNTVSEIIQRELANHEAQITYDISDTFDALDGYNITREQVQNEFDDFFNKCVENDWF